MPAPAPASTGRPDKARTCSPHSGCSPAVVVASIAGKSEERAVASLFSPGGTYAVKGEFAGINDFEVVAYLVCWQSQVLKSAAPHVYHEYPVCNTG